MDVAQIVEMDKAGAEVVVEGLLLEDASALPVEHIYRQRRRGFLGRRKIDRHALCGAPYATAQTRLILWPDVPDNVPVCVVCADLANG